MQNTKNGYTLIEMLVAIAIILIVVPVLFSSINSLYSSHATTLANALALTETTNGVKDVLKDVRSAVYAENGAMPLANIATSTFTLYSDTDSDGIVERVRYYLDNTTVWKGVIEPTSTSSYPESNEVITKLSGSIINSQTNTPLFKYFNSTSTEITSVSNILDVRRIETTFIGSFSFSNKTSEVKIRSSASIRNLKNIY